MANISYVGDGNVKLIAGGGKLYTGIAASFCRTEKDLDEIIANDDTKKIIKSIVDSGHSSALEFDDFIFAVSGYSRVTELHLVRKRHASYNIKSGRPNKHGKRSYDIVLPQDIVMNTSDGVLLEPNRLMVDSVKENHASETCSLLEFFAKYEPEYCHRIEYTFSTWEILDILESWYNRGVAQGYREEELRYMKPQATEFKAAIKMNAAALNDWAKIRMCNRSQTEVRDLCTKMIGLAKEAAPELFMNVGANCKVLGYCPELEQCEAMRGIIPTKAEALKLIRENYKK